MAPVVWTGDGRKRTAQLSRLGRVRVGLGEGSAPLTYRSKAEVEVLNGRQSRCTRPRRQGRRRCNSVRTGQRCSVAAPQLRDASVIATRGKVAGADFKPGSAIGVRSADGMAWR